MGGPRVPDRTISRQRAWQIKRVEQGLCPLCGKDTKGFYRCESCRKKIAIHNNNRRRAPKSCK